MRHEKRDGYFIGLLLIAVGTVVLLDSLRWVDLGPILDTWPFLLVALGIRKFIVGRTPRRFPKGAMMIFIGLWLYVSLNRIWGLSFSETWPALLIAGGASMAWKSVYPRSCGSPSSETTVTS